MAGLGRLGYDIRLGGACERPHPSSVQVLHHPCDGLGYRGWTGWATTSALRVGLLADVLGPVAAELPRVCRPLVAVSARSPC